MQHQRNALQSQNSTCKSQKCVTIFRNKIKILTWNSQGLQHKVVDLEEFFISNQIDIACIQETLLILKRKFTFQITFFSVEMERKNLMNRAICIGRGIASLYVTEEERIGSTL